MDIAKAFEVAFNRKIEKNWEKIYVVVDIHDTIIRVCYEISLFKGGPTTDDRP